MVCYEPAPVARLKRPNSELRMCYYSQMIHSIAISGRNITPFSSRYRQHISNFELLTYPNRALGHVPTLTFSSTALHFLSQ